MKTGVSQKRAADLQPEFLKNISDGVQPPIVRLQSATLLK